MADAAHYRELDFSAMKKHGTSYRILPDDYQKPTCSGRGPLEQLVLNDQYVSVATGTEDLNFKTMRKNQYEMSMNQQMMMNWILIIVNHLVFQERS